MNQNGLVLKGKNDLFSIQSSLTSDIDVVCKNFFERDPWEIILEKENIKKWIKEMKETEKNI